MENMQLLVMPIFRIRGLKSKANIQYITNWTEINSTSGWKREKNDSITGTQWLSSQRLLMLMRINEGEGMTVYSLKMLIELLY